VPGRSADPARRGQRCCDRGVPLVAAACFLELHAGRGARRLHLLIHVKVGEQGIEAVVPAENLLVGDVDEARGIDEQIDIGREDDDDGGRNGLKMLRS